MKKLLEKTILSVVFSTTIFLFSNEAGALMDEASLEDKVYKADLIVIGKVINTKGYLKDEERKIIYSQIEVASEKYIKGEHNYSILVIDNPGGCLEDGIYAGLCMGESETAKFKVGEDVLLFLKKKGEIFEVSYREQGKYTIENRILKENSEPIEAFINQISELTKQIKEAK